MGSVASLLALIWLAVASPAAAQDPVQDAPDAAAAHGLAEAAIERSGGDTVWENVTASTRPELRHRQSGALCRFWAGSLYPWARTDPYGITVPLGSEVSCSTWVRPGGETWSFEVDIEAAAQSLLGSRYQGFDGRFTPAFVTPEYRGRRSAYWASFRGGPLHHEPVRTIAGPDGAPLLVHGVRFAMLDRVSVTRVWTVLVNGWVVTQKLSTPAGRERTAELLALSHLQHIVSGMSRPHEDAAAVHARVEALRSAAAAPPPGLDDPTVRRIAGAFEAACVAPAHQRLPFADAIAAQPGWTAAATPPSGLPNIARNPAPRVWRVPGDGPQVYVHLDAAMTGDCAVSAYGADAALAGPALLHRLTQGVAARFAPGFRGELDPGIESQALEGLGWAVEASLITNTNDERERPVIFIGLRPPSQRPDSGA